MPSVRLHFDHFVIDRHDESGFSVVKFDGTGIGIALRFPQTAAKFPRLINLRQDHFENPFVMFVQ
ncbi:MAG: hypothetical protein CME31_03395 [Gimesia sp.]|nr:hypothetical protein [Gimesia sp.]